MAPKNSKAPKSVPNAPPIVTSKRQRNPTKRAAEEDARQQEENDARQAKRQKTAENASKKKLKNAKKDESAAHLAEIAELKAALAASKGVFLFT